MKDIRIGAAQFEHRNADGKLTEKRSDAPTIDPGWT